MKKTIKIFLCLLAVFIISLGIKANAVLVMPISDFEIILPIHKTDEAGKALEGVTFTLKDFNNTISYSSSDKKDGDYLIETFENQDSTLDKTINLLPSNYKEIITSVDSWEDVVSLQNRDDVIAFTDDYSDNIIISFIVPFIVEETNVPEGYQKQDIVVNGIVAFNFEKLHSQAREDIETRSDYFDYCFYNGFLVRSRLIIEGIPGFAPGYFVYDTSVDYNDLYKNINKDFKNLLYDMVSGNEVYYTPDELMEVLIKKYEDKGYNSKDVVCPDVSFTDKKMDLEDIQFSLLESPNASCNSGDDTTFLRFDESISNCFCVFQLKNKRKNITINPATASTIGIITLIVIGSVGFITSKKLRKND